jgi:hypothetical protein
MTRLTAREAQRYRASPLVIPKPFATSWRVAEHPEIENAD